MTPWWAVILIGLGCFMAGVLTASIAYIFTKPRQPDIEETHAPIIGKRFRGIE